MRHASAAAVVLGVLALSAPPARAKEWVRVEADLQAPAPAGDGGFSASIVVGQPFHLLITARHPRGGVALLPEAIDLGANFGERRAARTHQRRTEGDQEIDQHILELIAFDSGEHTLPAIPLAFGSTQAATPPLAVSVGSVLSDDEQMVAGSTVPEALAELEKMAAPQPPPRSVLIADRRPLYAIGALAGLAALIALAYWIRRRRRPAEEAAPPLVPARPAHEIALERLTRLARSDLLAKGEHKAFHLELSETMRAYVGDRYGFESIELTSSELNAALESRETPALDRAELRRLLELSDLVKFAKVVLPEAESRALLEAAVHLVRATTPRPASSGEAAELAPEAGA